MRAVLVRGAQCAGDGCEVVEGGGPDGEEPRVGAQSPGEAARGQQRHVVASPQHLLGAAGHSQQVR